MCQYPWSPYRMSVSTAEALAFGPGTEGSVNLNSPFSNWKSSRGSSPTLTFVLVYRTRGLTCRRQWGRVHSPVRPDVGAGGGGTDLAW